jgi:primosomal protein N' (replication factor Y)
MDTDTTSSRYSYEEMLGAFRRHEADVLLGTQMVTKGHDSPR